MIKAVLTSAVVFFVGIMGIVVGHELLNGFPEVGPVVAIATLAGIVAYYGSKRK